MRITDSRLFKGSVCLAEFPFTSLDKTKIRPVVILFHDKQYDDVLVVAVSSVITRQHRGITVPLLSTDPDFYLTGLKKSSVILCSRMVTLSKNRLVHSLGMLSACYLNILDEKIIGMMMIGCDMHDKTMIFSFTNR